ncbi:hypothetical protein E4O00_02735 [Treponema sp. OMZ 788]|uniref:cell division protein ZapB n=1 Tax=unclassified Treponema TaxID=2638727 RepID=UPI0020A28EE9|nr:MULTISPECIES: hypothetical protein [unclassified Treponema]UTC61887.1 hypothetical protein E4O05_10175 [Treponema sp. OMZ 787]UTC65107.1 hypothetical protein E4O00_02735 [Treponema sp. OMZ 788]
MLNLDQVRLLENKVERAVQMIKSLHTEKDSLKKEIEARDKRIAELEKLIVTFKDDQSKIEEGIINALNQLSAFEDASYTKKHEMRPSASEFETAVPVSAESEPESFSPPPTPPLQQAPAADPVSEDPGSGNLQKDLDDVLGQTSDTSKQMDIF